MRETLRAIDGIGLPGERRIRIGIAKDGSGVGAALIALVAANMERRTGLDYMGDLRRAAAMIKEEAGDELEEA